MKQENDIPCINCADREECGINTVLNNTLDNSKNHKTLTLTLEILMTVNEPQEFKDDFTMDCAEDVADGVYELSDNIGDLLRDINCNPALLGAELTVSDITNKEAFNKLVNYIKVTHKHD